MYSYLKCIVYDKLLKPRQSLRITLYNKNIVVFDRVHICILLLGWIKMSLLLLRDFKNGVYLLISYLSYNTYC